MSEKLEQAIFERTESMVEGATALTSLDIAALITQSKGKITVLPSKVEQTTGSDTQLTNEPETVDEDESDSLVEVETKTVSSNLKKVVTTPTEKPKSVMVEDDNDGFFKDFQSL